MVTLMAALAASPTGQSALLHWWSYVDERRSHEVLARWHDTRLSITESAPGLADPPYVWTTVASRPWEVHVALWTLESRLALMGKYWRRRSVDHGWTRVLKPVGAPSPDLRASDILSPEEGLILHHYHDEGERLDRVVAALRGRRSMRYAVIRAELELPALDVGRIALLHPRLPESVMHSVLTREQIALSTHGLSKLVTRDDYQRAFGHDGPRRVEDAIHQVVDRATNLQWEKPAPQTLGPVDMLDEFMATLEDPRLMALHVRFLEYGEEEKLMEQGAAAIKRAIALKRVHAEHANQHLLTILEASLLARERLKSGRLTRFDPEVRALTRLAYYL